MTSATARTMKRMATIAVQLVLVALVVGAVVLAAGPATGRYRTLTVVSGSMEPTLPVGSVLVYTPLAANAVEAGDIITFHPPGSTELMTHRVVSVDHQANGDVGVTTKGDANGDADPWELQLVGDEVWKVRAHIPAIGHTLVWLRGTAPMRLAIYAIPILLGLTWLVRIWSDDDDVREETGEPAIA